MVKKYKFWLHYRTMVTQANLVSKLYCVTNNKENIRRLPFLQHAIKIFTLFCMFFPVFYIAVLNTSVKMLCLKVYTVYGWLNQCFYFSSNTVYSNSYFCAHCNHENVLVVIFVRWVRSRMSKWKQPNLCIQQENLWQHLWNAKGELFEETEQCLQNVQRKM